MAKIRDRFFIAYDISDNRRRLKLVKILEKYGIRSQFSLFEFWLTPARKLELFNKLEKQEFLENKNKEGILIIPIPESFENRIERFGTTTKIYDEPCVAIV